MEIAEWKLWTNIIKYGEWEGHLEGSLLTWLFRLLYIVNFYYTTIYHSYIQYSIEFVIKKALFFGSLHFPKELSWNVHVTRMCFFSLPWGPRWNPTWCFEQKGATFFRRDWASKIPSWLWEPEGSYPPGFDQHILVTLTCFSTKENQDVVSNILQYFVF